MKFEFENFNFRFSAARAGLILIFAGLAFGFWHSALASTNISSVSPNYYAWSENIGWIDFYSTGNVQVSSSTLTGYASSSVGYIALNCNSTPNGDICAGPAGNWGVNNDGNGNLSGWAWNDVIGWISFDSTTASSTSYSYQVTIDPTTGIFSGWAWNDIIGWISFNSDKTDSLISYKVQSNWFSSAASGYLVSSVFDTRISGGSAINSIMWSGTQPANTEVKFQIASSNSSNGPWDYYGPNGTSDPTDAYFPSGPNVTIPISLAYNNNKRYVRYKVFLYSDSGRTATPIINNITINWSP